MQDVEDEMIKFIGDNTFSEYKLVVGTDSQVIGRKTCFATAIILHRVGTGTWACVGKQIESRFKWALRDKIGTETQITYETINELVDSMQDKILEYMFKDKHFKFGIEAHIDVGTRGKTRSLIREMEGYFRGVDITTRIKPDSYAASSVANKYSKCI